jgi:hypothetical protein
MSRRPRHRRRRPGRRPPAMDPAHRPSPPGPKGLTPPGWRQVHDAIPPHRGRDEHPYFREVDDGIIAVAGLVGAALGWTDLGLLGAVLGLWAGVSLCGMALEDGRPIRR